ncbi:MAG: 30S ribosomal protein S16 [Actinobacteria bacterium]|nr:30S ribosomal protein S16 [Actinomycetota bacterium]
MAVKIRLTRRGARKKPFYRVVVADAKMPRDGRFIEIVGTYNPLSEPSEVKIEKKKVEKWLKRGAIPTRTVEKLLSIAGIETK